MKEGEDSPLKDEFNGQTGKITWPELEKYFARGVLIKVANDLDLVEVALSISKDDKQYINTLLTENQLQHANIEDAKQWNETQPSFWAIVTAPWVLIQETTTIN
ncbi:hypothetical protein MNBD_GAMMA16-294 [hydrothermal vent metagenome]|uniref:DUF2288 domain-containing protein n=1 Tax=hydrothermal vent metagenome TaxID=652676 RepID=A0A3B0ZE36_9ZZZZ